MPYPCCCRGKTPKLTSCNECAAKCGAGKVIRISCLGFSSDGPYGTEAGCESAQILPPAGVPGCFNPSVPSELVWAVVVCDEINDKWNFHVQRDVICLCSHHPSFPDGSRDHCTCSYEYEAQFDSIDCNGGTVTLPLVNSDCSSSRCNDQEADCAPAAPTALSYSFVNPRAQ